MNVTTPTIIRPSSRFYAAFHRYLTTTTTATTSSSSSSSSCHPIHRRLPHPSHFTAASPSRYYATTSSTSSSSSAPTPPTHYTLFPSTLPQGPPPSSPFTPDLRALRREYLSLQSLSHPDKHPPHLKPRAEATSAAINDAYRTLTCPLKRSVYLLGLRGVDLGEGMEQQGDDEEFLEEVMEVRGEIDGAGEEGELEGVRRGNEGRVEECVRGLERGFEELGGVERGGGGDAGKVVQGLVRETVRLRYWIGVRESLDGWEKGKGGGALQH